MDGHLTPYETRVIGALIEKEICTPEQYPLSLNALTNACNQKSNRDPVLDLEETEVQATLDALMKKRLVSEKSGFGSRVVKYQHRFCNTEFSTLKFSAKELGIVCELLLRGPQTPGELRTHASRLCKFDDVQDVEITLQALMGRADGPFVASLPRDPGRREPRYVHLFGGAVNVAPAPARDDIRAPLSLADRERLNQLEQIVHELRGELERVKRILEQFTSTAHAEKPEV